MIGVVADAALSALFPSLSPFVPSHSQSATLCCVVLAAQGASITAVHNPSKAGEVAAGLAEMGFEVKETTVDEFFA